VNARSALLLMALACAGCAGLSERSTFAAFGGLPGITGMVDDLIDAFADDPRVAPTFRDTEMKRFREKFIEQMCVETGGPCTYSGDSMADSHGGLEITEGQFNAVVEDLQMVMERRGVPLWAQNALLRRLAPMRGDIVTR